MSGFEAFQNQQYLNLETFRKNGEGVKTPVWFTQDGDTLFVRTVANSGKVKRIRNFSKVNIAPCKSNGDLLGKWITAQASEVMNEETDRKVDQLLSKKYGVIKFFFDLTSKIQGRKSTVIEIHLQLDSE